MKFDYTNTPSCDTRIIQASPPGTGSTVALNLLHGLLCPTSPICIGPLSHNCSPQGSNRLDKFISKSHCIDYDKWEDAFGSIHRLYFLTTERDEEVPLNDRSNILIVPYKKILETKDYNLKDIVNYFYLACKDFLPQKNFTKNELEAKKDMYKRIDDMNKLYEEIKDKEFKYFDSFFGIHGGHRGRKTKGYYSKYK